MRAFRLAAAAALCLGLVAAACGDDDPDAATSAPGPMGATPAADDAADPADGSTVDADLLDFRTRTVEGDEVDAATFAGGDAVGWFWSPWCGSCNAEADGVGEVAAELGDRVPFLGIAGGGSQDEYERFLDDHDVASFPQLVDETGEIWLRFGADTIRSSFFFIDDTGETSVTGYGELDQDELRERVEALIAS